MKFAGGYLEKLTKKITETNKEHQNEGSSTETARTPRTENYSVLHPADPPGEFIKNKENQRDG